jgi:hypothetical protein
MRHLVVTKIYVVAKVGTYKSPTCHAMPPTWYIEVGVSRLGPLILQPPYEPHQPLYISILSVFYNKASLLYKYYIGAVDNGQNYILTRNLELESVS